VQAATAACPRPAVPAARTAASQPTRCSVLAGGCGARVTLPLRTLIRLHVWTFTVSKCFSIGKMVCTGGGYSRSSSAQARAAAADRSRLVPAAADPPGLELEMEPEAMLPAEQISALVVTAKVVELLWAAPNMPPENEMVLAPAGSEAVCARIKTRLYVPAARLAVPTVQVMGVEPWCRASVGWSERGQRQGGAGAGGGR
jgi:hypothetical protein